LTPKGTVPPSPGPLNALRYACFCRSCQVIFSRP